jgi:polyisoprenyl-phosphate glycosyltransferase
MERAQISVVIPVFNEEGNVEELYRRLTQVLNSVTDSYEIITVNDGSQDTTLSKLLDLQCKDKRLKIINFSRNFGQQAAITAGLEASSGEIVATLDADLQDPPELLPEFLAKLDQGFDVAYGVSVKRNDPPLRKFLFDSYYRVMDRLSPIKFPRHVGIFALMKRRVVEVLLAMQERNRFVPGLRSWVGFKQTGIPYEKPKRFAGKETQSLAKLFKMGFDSLFSFSYVPLRLATYLGLLVSSFAFLVIVQVLYQKLIAGTAILGWASSLTATLFIGGVQLVILGIIGEYLGRIYDEVKRRPYYIISDKLGF